MIRRPGTRNARGRSKMSPAKAPRSSSRMTTRWRCRACTDKVRTLSVLSAGLLTLGACASLSIVDKAPDRKTVSDILVKALACRDKPGEEPCDAALQPAEVLLAALDCTPLPLRSGFREAA